ncbi:MAG: hypothetical protein V3U35_00430 [Candidatus Neomarinimicrobiota bacterium]
MTIRTVTQGWALLLITLGACAAPGGGNGSSAYRDLRINLGQVSTSTIENRTYWVIQRHAYTLDRQELSPSRVYLETAWLVRQPFADERALGVLGAETRLIIEAGPLRGLRRTVWLVAENMVHMQVEGGMQRLANTSQFRQYIEALARDLRDEYTREELRL